LRLRSVLQEKLRVVEDLLSEAAQSTVETEGGRGCFLLARFPLEVEACATAGVAESGWGSVFWTRLLPARAQSAEEAEIGRGCFLL
jgi:hypothetical protein